MKKGISILLMTGWLLSWYGGFAIAGDPSPVFTLKECITMGLKQNLTLKAAWFSIENARDMRKAIHTDFLPKLRIQGTYQWIDNPITIDIPEITIRTPFGPLTSPETTVTRSARNSGILTTSLVQPLFTGGALTERYTLSKLQEQNKKEAYENARQALIESIKDAYFNLLKSQQIHLLMVTFVKQLTDHLQIAKAFLDENIIPLNDYLQTKVTLSNAKLNVIKAKNALRIAQSALNLLLNRDINRPIRAKIEGHLRPICYPLSHYQRLALASRPDLKVAMTRVEEAKSGVRLAKSGYYPHVVMSVNYRDLSDESLEKDSASVLVTANWSIFEWNKRKWEVHAKKARLEQAILMESQLKQLILQQVKAAYLNVKQSYRRIQTIRDAVRQAKENMRINAIRYQEQVATSTDVIDAQTLLLRTEVNLTVAKIDYLSALAALERAVGTSLTEEMK